MHSFLRLLLCMALPIATGALSGIATSRAIPDWYAGLAKPSFNPPDWVFGPVWTVLYLGLGWVLYVLTGMPAGPARTVLLWVFGVQMALNAAWSLLFFGLRSPGLALADIGLLILSIMTLLVLTRKSVPETWWVLLPYLAWVSFATLLNLAIWKLNP